MNVVGFTRKLDDPLAVTIEFDEEEVDIFRMLAAVLGDSDEEGGPGGDTTNVYNEFLEEFEELWQALNALVIPDKYTDLSDTPSSLGDGGEIHQVNAAGSALAALVLGANQGMRLSPNSEGDAIEWVNQIQYTGADKAALGTPPVPAFGLITTTGDNRLMFWDKEAADEATPDTDDWRDVASYGKTAT